MIQEALLKEVLMMTVMDLLLSAMGKKSKRRSQEGEEGKDL